MLADQATDDAEEVYVVVFFSPALASTWTFTRFPLSMIRTFGALTVKRGVVTVAFRSGSSARRVLAPASRRS